jgi:hypothetical protein
MLPLRVQLSRRKGWRLPPNTVVVARPTQWGNPYPVDEAHSPAMVVEEFEQYLKRDRRGKELAATARRLLKGKNLACWCPLDRPCHADVLLKLANA